MAGYQVELVVSFPRFHMDLAKERLEHDGGYTEDQTAHVEEMLDFVLTQPLRRRVQEFDYDGERQATQTTIRWYCWTQHEADMLSRLAQSAAKGAGWRIRETSLYEIYEDGLESDRLDF